MSEFKSHSENFLSGFMNIENMPVFFSAPHRIMFFAGSIQLILVLLFWSIELAGRFTSLWAPLPLSVPDTWVHVFLMIYGLYPFFMFGFLMTTYPKWLNTDPVPVQSYVPAFLLLVAGVLLFYIGIFTDKLLVEIALILFLCGWLVALVVLLNIYFSTAHRHSVFEHILSSLITIGFAGGCSNLLWLLSGNDVFLQFSIIGGFWLFLIPVLITVSHRMIPFFSSMALEDYDIKRPFWALAVMISCLTGHALLIIMSKPQWTFIFDFLLAGIACYLSWLWGFRKSFKVPLLAMLHIAFLWLPVGMLMSGIQSLNLYIFNELILGKAPVHAIGIGFATSLVLAMATRVTLGHSGRNLIAAKFTIGCFWLLQLIALFRIFGDIPRFILPNMHYWTLLAGILWIFCFLLWASHFTPIYLKPRVDGRPG